MAKIPETVIENVREHVNITDVVSQYVQLKKSGKNLFGRCPFHEERTPSFSVSESKQIFHCFSCGRGGNVFSFLMEIKNISFPAAVVEVAKMQGIPIAEQYLNGNRQKNGPDEEQRQLLMMYDEVAHLYHHILMNTDLGEQALTYLHSRKLSDETIAAFQLGFAPPNRLLQSFLKEKQFSPRLISQSGLFVENDQGTLNDRFFNRVMYPIRNVNGQTIAFSGRQLVEKGQAKYLNSPETKLFSKRAVLFNLDKARKQTQSSKTMVLFEGFMDVISAYQAGVKNGVASMGTSLTDQQVHQLNRSGQQLLICYDGDEPGQKAINRTLTALQNTPLKLGVIQMPVGVDPDEYRRQNGDAQFQQLMHSAQESPITFKLRFLSLHRDLNRDDDRIAYLDDALAVIAQVATPVERDVYVNQLVQRFQIDKQAALDQIQALRKHQRHLNPQSPLHMQSTAATAILDNQPMVKGSKIERAEQFLLWRMLHDHDTWLQIASIADFCFADDQYQMVYLLAEGYFNTHDQYNAADFIDTIAEPRLQKLVINLEQLPIPKQSYKGELTDYVNIIMNEAPLEHQIREKQAQMVESTRTGDLQTQIKVGMELIALQQQKQFGRNQSE